MYLTSVTDKPFRESEGEFLMECDAANGATESGPNEEGLRQYDGSVFQSTMNHPHCVDFVLRREIRRTKS